MKNGPLLVHTGRCQVMRVRYRLRPWGDSSSASEMRFMYRNVAQAARQCRARPRQGSKIPYLCKPRSSGSSVEVLITLVCRPFALRQAYSM